MPAYLVPRGCFLEKLCDRQSSERQHDVGPEDCMPDKHTSADHHPIAPKVQCESMALFGVPRAGARQRQRCMMRENSHAQPVADVVGK